MTFPKARSGGPSSFFATESSLGGGSVAKNAEPTAARTLHIRSGNGRLVPVWPVSGQTNAKTG
jgi:hypothetical protein